MDSVSQAALGAVVCHATIGPIAGRRALVLGAALGTLPDLDVLVRYADAVDGFTRHRSWSHSLFLLTLAAPLVASVARRIGFGEVSYARLLLAVWLVLITHPLLDALTVYGTQIWWPIDVPPTVWGSLFIIDPLVTLPLLLAIAAAVWPRGTQSGATDDARPHGERSAATARTRGVSLVCLALVSSYAVWTLVAKQTMLERAHRQLEMQALEVDRVVALPLPLSLLWRILAVDGERYLEGYGSLLDGNETIDFVAYPRGLSLLERTADQPAVARLRWFTGDQVKAEADGDRLALTDLRIGAESNYVFGFDVARRQGDDWAPMVARARPEDIDVSLLIDIWARMWDPAVSLAPEHVNGQALRAQSRRESPEP